MNRYSFNGLVSFLFVLTALTHIANASPKSIQGGDVIYGVDNRADLYQISHKKTLGLADSTVGFFNSSDLKVNQSKQTATFVTQHYGKSMNLCKDERFYDQPLGPFCSGSLVGEDLILTAGHCIEGGNACKSLRVVFGYSIKKKGKNPESVPVSEIYSCTEIVRADVDNEGADYALIRLDRAVKGHKPIPINRAVTSPRANLMVMGHPSGLPLKVATGAKIRNNEHEDFFVANLDTYQGNSGSPVFNRSTGKIEGILVRGEDDFERDAARGCNISKRCTLTECRGEDVTRVAVIKEDIPRLKGEK